MGTQLGGIRKNNALTAVIYWIILGIFAASYLISGNPLSLSVVTDRVVDALSITLIFVISRIAEKPLTEHFSYGYHRAETLMNVSVILLFLALAAFSATSTTLLLASQSATSSYGTIIASAVSIPLIIFATALIESDEKSNFHVMFLHSIQDIAIIAITLAFSLAAFYSNEYSVAYFGSYAVLAIIIYGNRKMFGKNLTVLMEGAPVNISDIEESIRKEYPNAHHLHVWDICQHERMATLHLEVPSTMQVGELDATKQEIERRLSGYGVTHVTIQFESENGRKA